MRYPFRYKVREVVYPFVSNEANKVISGQVYL